MPGRNLRGTKEWKGHLGGGIAGAGISALAIAALLLLAGRADAQPANDNFADAAVISEVPFANMTRTVGATIEPEEPKPNCAPVGKTVWYAYSSTADGYLVTDTIGSDFDTVLAVYTGSDLGGLEQVDCNDDGEEEFTSKLSFFASAGTTYYLQVGGFDFFPAGGITADSGNLVFNLMPPGSLSGTVIKTDGEPLPYVCVAAIDASSSFPAFAGVSITESDGRYIVENLPAGQYKVAFDDCNPEPAYASEWYDEKLSFASADVVPVSAGADTPNIDAALEPLEPCRGTDLGLTGLSVENVPIETDNGKVGGGWMRQVDVEASNLSGSRRRMPSFGSLPATTAARVAS